MKKYEPLDSLDRLGCVECGDNGAYKTGSRCRCCDEPVCCDCFLKHWPEDDPLCVQEQHDIKEDQ